jgi:chondroitin AC lyase
MYGGILRGEHATVKTAANYIKSSIRQGVYPGVQTDWSYHHHGPQNQLGVYGSAFAQDMARYAHLFKDTDCALSSEQLAILGGFLTEGVGWVVWKGAIDANCIGRTVSRKGVTSRFDYLFSTYKLMSEVGPEYKTPCLDYIKRNSSGGTNNLIGNKHFWQSDLMVHRAKTWYASARMSSNRTIGVESSNRENLRGYFAADGVLLLYVTGREYEEIFPVWDWRRLPGITCLQAGDPPPMPRRLQGTTDFVGGVSDGKTGISVLEYDRCALSAQKAWFFLDDAVVCMGAGIRSDEAHPVATSVNQCLLQGDVVEDADRYWHGSIGYHFPSRQKVTCRRGPQSGSWSQLTEATVDPATDKVEKDVFSLSIDHGATPKSATYLYVIYPGIAADELQSKAEEEKIVLVSNNTDIQGIYDKSKKRHMVAFWEAGSIQLNNKRTLKVDSPCLLMLGDTGGAAVLFISDPTQKLEAVTVELTGFKPLSIQLPAAPCRGDSLETHLSPL